MVRVIARIDHIGNRLRSCQGPFSVWVKKLPPLLRNRLRSWRSSAVSTTTLLPCKIVVQIMMPGVDTGPCASYLLPLAPSLFYPQRRPYRLPDPRVAGVQRLWINLWGKVRKLATLERSGNDSLCTARSLDANQVRNGRLRGEHGPLAADFLNGSSLRGTSQKTRLDSVQLVKSIR
jgi:hypothetical protein